MEEPASLHWRGVHRAGHQLHKQQQSRGKRLATLPPSAGRSHLLTMGCIRLYKTEKETRLQYDAANYGNDGRLSDAI